MGNRVRTERKEARITTLDGLATTRKRRPSQIKQEWIKISEGIILLYVKSNDKLLFKKLRNWHNRNGNGEKPHIIVIENPPQPQNNQSYRKFTTWGNNLKFLEKLGQKLNKLDFISPQQQISEIRGMSWKVVQNHNGDWEYYLKSPFHSGGTEVSKKEIITTIKSLIREK